MVDTTSTAEFPDAAALLRALEERCPVDRSRFESHREVTYKSLAGDTLRMRHTGGRSALH